MFAEPWQAQALAMTVALAEQGRFSWGEWTEALAEELRSAARRGEPDDGSHYYHHWVAALEKLVAAKALASPRDLQQRRQDWEDAYLHTPHGQPVHLGGTGKE